MKRIFTSLCISIALLFVGCVDRDFDLADTSGEITIGGEELVVPLGDLSAITIGDLLNGNDTLTENEDGVYQIAFSSFGSDPTKYENISIDGFSIPSISCDLPKLSPITFSSVGELPNSFTIGGINNSFKVDIPTVGSAMNIEPMNTQQELSINLPSFLPTTGSISSALLTQLQRLNRASVKSSEEHEVVFDAEITILKELKEVKWVEFGCDEHPHGAPFEAKLSLNGLYGINGGGELKFRIEFPEGYHLNDKDGNELSTHNVFESSYHIEPMQKEIDVLLYLAKIDYKGEQFTDGKLKINDHIRYSYDLTMNVSTGDYDLGNIPTFSFSSAPKYKDIEIVIGQFDVPNDEDIIQYDMNMQFNGLPSGINVSKVAFEEAPLKIALKGLEWLKVRCYDTGDTFSPPIEVVLPECIRFKEHKLLNNTTNTLIATTSELNDGISLIVDHIDCNANGVSQKDGKLSVNAKFLTSIHLEGLSNHTIHLSSLTPPSYFTGDVTLAIEETSLKIDSERSEISSTNDMVFPFDFGDQVPAISQEIAIPDMVASIKSISIGKANSDKPVQMTLSLDKSSTFPVDELVVSAAVNLGNILKPTSDMLVENGGNISKDRNGNYIYSINESWRPKQSSLTKILKFEALENIPAIVNGKIAVKQSFPITGSVKIKRGESFDLSAVSNAKVNINLSVDDIEVRSFEGCLDIAVKPDPVTVRLEGMESLDIDINSLNINPIFKLKLKDNPTGVALSANVSIKTFDAEDNVMNNIEIPTISINERGASNIVISTPHNENKYQDEDVLFISAPNLSKLLSNGVPAKIVVDLEVNSDKEKVVTVDLSNTEKGYNIEYQYEVIVPLEFDNNTDISCETSIMGLNSTFVSLADSTEGLKVGDIGLIAEIGTTIPFDLILDAELLNANGTTENVEAKLDLHNCIIKGYTGKNGEDKMVSNIEINFDLGDSHTLESLKNIDGVRLKFTLYSTGDNAALKSDQFIDGTLKLRIRDGLTLDIVDFLKDKKQ